MKELLPEQLSKLMTVQLGELMREQLELVKS